MENDEASIESIGGNSDCGDSYVPLTDTQRYIVIVAHYVSTYVFFCEFGSILILWFEKD